MWIPYGFYISKYMIYMVKHILCGFYVDSLDSTWNKLGLGTSPGLRRVLASILVGILMGNMTRGSSSPAKTDR